MNSKKGICCLAVVCIFMLVACGDENTTEVTEQIGMQVLPKNKTLPGCTKDNAGNMLYVTDSSAVYYCAEGDWNILNGKDGESIKGDKGDKGDDGDKGDQGNQGDQGDKGDKGAQGESAYELSGFEGTESEWLESLNGNDGVGCKIEDKGNGEVELTCGESGTPVTLYKAMCGNKSYDPEKQLCDSRDNQVYNTVKIGNQVWMAQNLNFAPDVTNEMNAGYKGRIWCYENEADSCTKYGRLYTWAAAMDSAMVFSSNGKGCGYDVDCEEREPVRGICPEGWHLPSKAEWQALFQAVGGQDYAAYALKSKEGWNMGNGSDMFGFTALPTGFYHGKYGFRDVGDGTLFWSSTEDDEIKEDLSAAYGIFLFMGNDLAFLGDEPKTHALSIRCMQN